MAGQEVRQLARTAECHAVSGVDLVGNDAETLGDHAAHEGRWEEPVLRHSTNLVGTAGHPSSGHGLL